MKGLLLMGLFLGVLPAKGQAGQPQVPPASVPVLALHGKLPKDTLDVSAYTSFYQDYSGDTLPLSAIRAKPFRPFVERPRQSIPLSNPSVMVTWLRFTLRNTHSRDTLRLYYRAGYAQGQITVFAGTQQIDQTGFDWAPRLERPSPFLVPITLPPNTQHIYWVRVMNFIGEYKPICPQVMTVEAGWRQHLQENRSFLPLLICMSGLAGCVLFMGAYALYHYWLVRDQAFLYYSLYAGWGLFHFVQLIDYQFYTGIITPLYPTALLVPVNYRVAGIFYGLFLNQVLHIRRQQSRIWKIVRLLMGLVALQQAISLMEGLLGWPLFGQVSYYQWVGLISGLLLLLLLLAIFRSRSPIRSYLLAGNVCLIGLITVPMLLYPYLKQFSWQQILNFPGLLAMVGFTGELFCFAAGLAYRSRLIELEKRQLQQRHAAELAEKLNERTREVEARGRELEAQHLRQLEQSFEQRLAETEMSALRAQMNPHFIFNCLNSIKLYASENESEQAADYLTKFARLIRLVLENSRTQKVTLLNELEALRLYLEMEALRFEDKLHFALEVSPEIEQEYLEIPPLLIQPYVENAIWHGLMHKVEGGWVRVRVEQVRQDHLLITVTDNGIGRLKAAQLKSKSASQRKSFGMKVTSERIALINQLYQHKTTVEVQDLVDTHGEPAGTEVVLRIPL